MCMHNSGVHFTKCALEPAPSFLNCCGIARFLVELTLITNEVCIKNDVFFGQEPTRHLKLSSKKGKPVMWIMSG